MPTVRQAASVLLANPDGSLKLQSLRSIFPGRSLSIRAILMAFDAQRVLIFVQVRPVNLLQGISTPSDLVANWNTHPATPATLQDFADFLKPTGVTIVYVSKDGQTVGLRGTNNQLLQIKAIKINDPNATPGALTQTGLANIGQGLGAGVGGGALFATSAAGLVFLGIVGLTAAAVFLVLGIYQLIAASERDDPPAQASVAASPTPAAPSSTEADDPVDYSLANAVLGQIVDDIGGSVIDSLINIVGGEALPAPGDLPGAGDLAPGGEPVVGGPDPGLFGV